MSGERLIGHVDDGILLCLAGDPENALSTAMTLHERLCGQQGDVADSVRYRFGMHLGSVTIGRGADGRAQPAGEALTIARQVSRFAAPDQLIASRGFQQVITDLSPGYGPSFRSLGTKHDGHGREYMIYEIVQPCQGAAARGVPAPLGPSTQTIAFHTGWEQAELTAATNALTPYVGDQARIVVKEAAERAASVAHFYRLLAQSIPSAEGRQKFCTAHGVEWSESGTAPPGD